MRRIIYILPIFFGALMGGPVGAEQPVFDEMPRWKGGWGVQVLQEYRLKPLSQENVGPFSSTPEEIHLTHIQGVYTWDKSIRITGKLPIVLHAVRGQPDSANQVRKQKEQGIDDLTLALPLKRYFNLDGRSGSWTLAPQLRVPLGNRDDYNVHKHLWGNGLSLGYETETHRWLAGVGATTWHYWNQHPIELDLEFHVGVNVFVFGTSGHIKWKNDLRFDTDGYLAYRGGPTLYWRIDDTWHGQIQWKHMFFERKTPHPFQRGDSFRLGLAAIF